MLPESFRDSTRPRLRNPVLVDWAPGFLRRPDDAMAQAEPLAGTFFHLDPLPRGETFDLEACHSDFAVDPDREGRFLRTVLGDL